MANIVFVGGMVGDSLGGVTEPGMKALARAEKIVFPGDWIGDRLKDRFGDRLVYGRSITEQEVLRAFSTVSVGAILFAGNPRWFTGRPGSFPPSPRLAEILATSGHAVDWCTGSSFVELAMSACGWSLDVERGDSLVVPPALTGQPHRLDELASYAATPGTLALLWGEDHAPEAWTTIKKVRGPSTPAAVVSRLGYEDEAVHVGSLAELEPVIENLKLPSVLLVRPNAAPKPTSHDSERRMTIGVIGGAGENEDAGTAEAVGRAIIDAGCNLITGGLGGVMEAACRGARSSKRYREGAITGVVPSYEPNDANQYCDVVIATGLNHARNILVAGSSDAIVVIGGGAGTLSEIAFAWTLGRPIVAVESGGWAERMAGVSIDSRREDRVHGPFEPVEAVRVCVELGGAGPRPRREF